MQDRVPTKPNRYAVYDDAHNFIRYEYHERADEPTQVGDALNKANLLPDAVATALGLTGNPQVKDALEKLSGAALTKTTYTELSTLPDGAEFTLNETIGGTTATVKFIKLRNNYEDSGRVLVIRKDAIAPITWNSASTNAYSGSTLDTYLNSTYIGFLNSDVQAAITNVNIRYTVGNGNTAVSTLARKCFALSATEYGLSNANANVEGLAVAYFSSNPLRAAYNNGAIVPHSTRTPMRNNTTEAFFIRSSPEWEVGTLSNASVTSTIIQARPAFTLPADFGVTDYPNNTLTDMSGNDFPLPYAKIATGSYTGTGTFGSSNKNSLTLDFPPKRISIINSTGIVFGELVIKDSTVYGYSYSGAYVALTGSINGNTISWYAADAAKQLNASGVNYLFVTEG